MAKRKPRLVRLNKARNATVAVYLSNSHRSRGQDLAGYRVVRLLRLIWDRRKRTAVLLRVRLFGHGDWLGPIVTLDTPKSWTGAVCGVVRGKTITPIDVYVQELYGKSENPVCPDVRRNRKTDHSEGKRKKLRHKRHAVTAVAKRNKITLQKVRGQAEELAPPG